MITLGETLVMVGVILVFVACCAAAGDYLTWREEVRYSRMRRERLRRQRLSSRGW